MPGLHTIIRYKKKANDKTQNCEIPSKKTDFLFAVHEPYFKIKILDNGSDFCITYSYYDGYPISEWVEEDIIIVLEGFIFNRNDNEIKSCLTEIALQFIHGGHFQDIVKRFVESSDGEYVVQIFQKSTKKLLIFNDYLGRLSLYYYFKDGLCIISKEIKTVLTFIPKIELNDSSLIEFLMFEFPLGNKTLFKDIYRLQSAQMIVIQENIEVTSSAEFNFILSNSFTDKHECIIFLKDAFINSIKSRVNTLNKKDYSIIADLSGGYDSRTVLGGLSKCTKNVNYFTQEYCQDESPIALKIFQKMGSPGNYQKLSFINQLDEQTLGELIYKTDGLVDYTTTSICYQDVKILKKNAQHNAIRFGGLGGEFIRHPYKKYSGSLLKMCEEGVYSQISLKSACSIIKKDHQVYKKELSAYFNTYPEKSKEDQLKRFYYEYYHNYVGAAANIRETLQFWTVQPLWNLIFIRAIFTRIPLQWINYGFFIHFMDEIDPKLKSVPIFKSNIQLDSKISVAIFDVKQQISISVYDVLVKFRLYNILKDFRESIQTKLKKDENKELFARFTHYYNDLHVTADLFDLNSINRIFFETTANKNRIFTLIIYLNEIEKRFGYKFFALDNFRIKNDTDT